jgi:protein-disulfide isomerase
MAIWWERIRLRFTVVEFGDYECLACRIFHRTMAGALAEYPRELALVYRHLPLPYHANAYSAAKAAECAALQGRFREYHDHLYSQTSLAGADWVGFAAVAGVSDLAIFEQCVSSADLMPEVERDIDAAKRLGARGTPTIIVNGVWLGAVPDSASFFALLKGMVAGQ